MTLLPCEQLLDRNEVFACFVTGRGNEIVDNLRGLEIQASHDVYLLPEIGLRRRRAGLADNCSFRSIGRPQERAHER